MRIVYSFLLILVLSGCPYDPDRKLKNPQIDDVMGKWENSGFNEYAPYALVEIRRDGTGEVVLANEETAGVFVRLEDFKFFDYELSFKVTFIDPDSEEKPSIFRAALIRDQLCVTKADGEEVFEVAPFWCFVRSNKLDDFKRDAQLAHEKYKSRKARNKKRNEMDGNVVPSIR